MLAMRIRLAMMLLLLLLSAYANERHGGLCTVKSTVLVDSRLHILISFCILMLSYKCNNLLCRNEVVVELLMTK